MRCTLSTQRAIFLDRGNQCLQKCGVDKLALNRLSKTHRSRRLAICHCSCQYCSARSAWMQISQSSTRIESLSTNVAVPASAGCGDAHETSKTGHTLWRCLYRRGRLALEDTIANRAVSVNSEGLVVSRRETRWDSPRPCV